MSRAIRLAREAKEIFRQADAEHRPLTADERTYAQGLLDEAQEVGQMEKQITDVGRQLGSPGDDVSPTRSPIVVAAVPATGSSRAQVSKRSAIRPPAVSNGPPA